MRQTHLETKTVKPVTNRVKLDKMVKVYIIDAINPIGYSNTISTASNDATKLNFLYKTFKSEYSWSIERYGEQKAFSEWIMGLPSSFNIEFENYKILELARSWGSINPLLNGRALELRKDLILYNWFNFITVKTFQLFKKYRIGG